ncbi:MAG: hypothetical protein IPK25_00815 [Saprospiraceae bacterium]|nr:hypothetical protein [Saprospiraceae bacterium]
MDEIKILLKLFDSLKGKNHYQPDNKVALLEKIIRTHPEKSDEELKSILFSKKKNNNYFGVLKSRLQQDLFNRILIESGKKENISNRLNQLFDIQRKFIIASILNEKNERALFIKIMEKLYKQSVKWEYTLYSMLISKNLYAHYAFYEPNKYKMHLYKEAFKQNEKLLVLENRIYTINAEISHVYQLNRSGFVHKNLEFLKDYMDEVIQIHHKSDVYAIKIFTYDLIAFYYLILKDYDKVINIAEEGKIYFNSKPFSDNRATVNNNLNIINAYIYKNELETALHYVTETLQIINSGTRIWNRLKSFEFIIYTLKKEYENLYSVYFETKPKIKLDLEKEEWHIRSGYIHFLIRVGKIPEQLVEENKKDSFVLSRFLNSVPFYTKDKSGLNISIIIIQILFYFLEKKWDKVLDKIDGLKQYSFRYLTKDESMRSNCFIKMIIAAEKANFNRQLTITYTKTLYEKMISSPYVLSENSAFVEIIPYETLWELTLELLSTGGNKRYYLR